MTGAPTQVTPMGFMRSPLWWRLLARCLALAVVSALLALGFIGLVDRGIEWLASEDPSNEAFSGSPWIFVTLVVAGFIIGLIYKLVAGTREVNVFEGLEVGKVDTLSVPGGLGVAVTSLVSGASLGPEVPTGMLAGGMATWVSEHQGWDDDERKVAVQSSVGSAWGGLFTTPFVPSLMALELNHRQSPAAWPLVMIQALSSVTGFAIFYLAGGWAEVIRFLSLPEYSFDLVDLAFAGLVGVVGAAGAMLFVVLHRRLEAVARTLATRPVLRSTIGGALLGVLGVALPLTLYNGAEGLATVTTETAELGVTLILVSAIAKLVATTTALAFGFIGGPIFPALFTGGSVGVVLHEVIPSMPLAIAVPGSMAAITAALVAVPFSVSVLVMLIAGASIESAPPVLTAAVISFVIVRGLAPTPTPNVADLSAAEAPPDRSRSRDAHE